MNRIGSTLKRGEEAQIGGFVKNRRTKGPPHEGPGEDRMPRHQKVTVIAPEEPEEPQAPAELLPAVSAEKPPEKKIEGVEMKTATAQTNPEFAPCPMCGYSKTINGKRFLVCKACNDRFDKYVDQAAKEIVSGKKDVVALSKVEWVLSQLDLARFEQELATTRAQRWVKSVHEWAIKKAEADCEGKSVPLEILNAVIAQHENKRNDELYFTVKRLNARLIAATELKPELEQMIAAEAAPVVPATVPEPVTNP